MTTQPQNNIQVRAPGFSGLNTQDSPVGMGLEFASTADHCIIDDYGRIGSRKGLVHHTLSVNTSDLGVLPAARVFEFVDITGVSWIFVTGNGKIFLQQQVSPFGLVVLPYLDTITVASTQNNWQMVGLGDRCYFVQEGLPILQFHAETQGVTPGLTNMQTADTLNQFPAANGWPSCATTGFGILWVGGFDTNKNLIAYTELNTGGNLLWEGRIDVTQFWPGGVDAIQAIRIHNNFLLVFGKRSILVYEVPNDAVTFIRLVDTIEGIGCIARDSVATIGKDIYFLDSTGVRSFGRTISEKSMPIGDISWNVKNDIQLLIKNTNPEDSVAVYSPENNLYTLSFPTQGTTYALNTKGYLENGSLKITRWPNTSIFGGCRTTKGDTFFCGIGGLFKYTGPEDITYLSIGPLYVPPGSTPTAGAVTDYPVPFKYWTQPQTFEQAAKLKLLKQLDITFIGGSDVTLFLKWDFDYNVIGNQVNANYLSDSIMAYYDEGFEYDSGAEYSGVVSAIQVHQLNLWGSGRVVRFGFETSVSSEQFSIQELNIQALLGRTI